MGWSNEEELLIKGWRAGAVEALTMVYQNIATKMCQAGKKRDMTKRQALSMPPPQTARDYYYEARGLVNAFHFLTKQYNFPLTVTPEQAVEWFWDSDLSIEEIYKIRNQWTREMDNLNTKPRGL